MAAVIDDIKRIKEKKKMKNEEINTALKALDGIWESYCHLVDCAYTMYASGMDYVQTECIGLHQWRTKGGVDKEIEWEEATKAIKELNDYKENMIYAHRDSMASVVDHCITIVKKNLGV